MKSEETLKCSFLINLCMTGKAALSVLLCILVLGSIDSLGKLKEAEFQITRDLNDQNHPAIYGDMIVWQDERNGISDIYGYNFSTATFLKTPKP